MISEIFSFIGIGIWATGIAIAFFLFLANDIARFTVSFACILLFGSLGFIVGIHGILSPVKNIKIGYETPMSIIKTNDITIITHKVGKRVIGPFVQPQASYWNSTNIKMKSEIGDNFYGISVGPFYSVECN